MKSGFSVFLVSLVALGASWFGLVYAPLAQLGGETQTVVLQSTDKWPPQPTGAATLGLQVYRQYGCAACHTEQVQQTGAANELTLTSLEGHPPQEFREFLQSLLTLPELMNASNAIAANLDQWNGSVPKTLYSGQDGAAVTALADKLKAVKVKADARIVALGPDIQRGWGLRQSVAPDYLYDQPVQLGQLRAGPDLATIGVREPDANWQLLHLYAPQSVVPGSTMPPFRTLFEVRKKSGGQSSPDALALKKEFAPPDDQEVVPTAQARQLVAYLLSLKANAPLYQAPFTPLTPGSK